MPTLGPDDALPGRPARVLVAGTSGSGKTTLAGRIAAILSIPHVEIDALYHGPGWTPRESFVADVHRFIARPAWVTEWQYSPVKWDLAERAELLVWLDLPRWTVMRQVTRRTLVRRLRRQELWNGNVEPPLWTIFTDRDHIVRWAWNQHSRTSLRIETLRQRQPELPIVQLRSRAAAALWCGGALATVAKKYQPDGL
jgi:adenylate kinase family enzyme